MKSEFNINLLIESHVPFVDETILVKKKLKENGKLTKAFFALYRNYRILLEHILRKKLSLDEYDKRIFNSELLFHPVLEEDKDFYQYISTAGLYFFFLRSEIYVEKLSPEEIEYVIQLPEEELFHPGKETIDLVEKTWRSLIDRNTENDCCYGPPGNDWFWFPSDELVIGFRYDEFADDGLGENEEWLENNVQQKLFLNELMEEMNEKYQMMDDVKVNVVWYDEYTIDMPVSDLPEE